MEETPSAKTYLGWAVAILGGLALLAALLLALWHVFEWLRDGIWPHLTGGGMLAALGIPHPALPWPWAQSVVDWILSWSAAFLLTCTAIILFILGSNLSADYDQKVVAAKKARTQFAPASDAARAASRAHGASGAQADGDPEETRQDDEGEQEPPPPAAPRTVWQAAMDNLLGVGCVVLLFVGGLGLVVGWDYFDRIHYDRVSARVLTVTRGCVLEWEAPRDPAIWESSGPRRSEEMSCDQAGRQARGMNPRAIEVMAVTYRYVSPQDGRTYEGALHRDAIEFPPDVRVGGEMPIYSLTADPSRSRGIYQWPVD